MNLGLLNACLMAWNPSRIAGFAREEGFSALELHGGPRYTAASWSEVAAGSRDAVMAIREPLEQNNLTCSGIMFGNLPYLDADPAKRTEAAEYLSMLIRAAANLDIPVVSTFTGRAVELDLEGNIERFKMVFTPIAEQAERAGVTVAFENCAMTGGFKPATNIAYSPDIWKLIFDAVPSSNLGLNFDPSHLQWMGADVVAAVREFGKRIVHVQAKDAEVIPNRLASSTILADGWWRYRIPGYGDVPWVGFFSALREVGYVGTVSIEHEDPVFEGSDEKIIDGLRRAASFLTPYL
jgi:sugar phosphate isomerase/epimerase